MSCPHNSFGQPTCHITAHPDRPHEKFCATCKKRFTEQEPPGLLLLILLLFIGLFLAL